MLICYMYIIQSIWFFFLVFTFAWSESLTNKDLAWVGMTTKPTPVIIHPNQIQFDGFSPFWLGLDMSMGFPRSQNTGMGRVTGI